MRRHPRTIDWANRPPLPIELRIYLAGLFDGEGSIGISEIKGRRQWALSAVITNTDAKALQEIYTETDELGCFGVVKKRKRPLYGWRMSHLSAAWFLQQIRPWLKIRDRQADLAIRFSEFVRRTQRSKYRHPLSVENTELRERFRCEISALNKQGRQEIPNLSPRDNPHIIHTLPALPEELKIYLAGLFDGEGCVVIGQVKNKNEWFLRAVTAITDGITLRSLFDATNRAGNFALHRRKNKNIKRKDIYSWTMSGRTARWFLYQILPWLRIKERQARAGLIFSGIVAVTKGERPTIRNLLTRQFYKQQIHDMNRRGRANPYPTSDFVSYELSQKLQLGQIAA